MWVPERNQLRSADLVGLQPLALQPYYWNYTNKQRLTLTLTVNIDSALGSSYKRLWLIGCWVTGVISALIPHEDPQHSQSCQIKHRRRVKLSLGQTFAHFSTSDNTDAAVSMLDGRHVYSMANLLLVLSFYNGLYYVLFHWFLFREQREESVSAIQLSCLLFSITLFS